MYIDFDGHHSGGSSFDMYMIFGFWYKMWVIPTGTSSALKKKKSQYMVSHPELGLDRSIRSGRESGCDRSGRLTRYLGPGPKVPTLSIKCH